MDGNQHTFEKIVTSDKRYDHDQKQNDVQAKLEEELTPSQASSFGSAFNPLDENKNVKLDVCVECKLEAICVLERDLPYEIQKHKSDDQNFTCDPC